MKKLLFSLLLAAGPAFAAGPVFDASSAVLTLPTLTIGADTYTNAKIKIKDVEVLAIDPLAPGVPKGTVCTDTNFTKAIVDKLRSMNGQAVTLKQLEGVIGCSVTNVMPSGDVFAWKSTGPSGTLFQLSAVNGVLDTSGLPILFY